MQKAVIAGTLNCWTVSILEAIEHASLICNFGIIEFRTCRICRFENANFQNQKLTYFKYEYSILVFESVQIWKSDHSNEEREILEF